MPFLIILSFKIPFYFYFLRWGRRKDSSLNIFSGKRKIFYLKNEVFEQRRHQDERDAQGNLVLVELCLKSVTLTEPVPGTWLCCK